MAYKSGHIYLIDHEPTAQELGSFAKPVQFDICGNGQFYSILYDKAGNKFIQNQSKIVTGFIKIGEIVQNANQITIGVHPSGFNHWRINGVDVTTGQAAVLEVDPVADGEFRIDCIVGNSAGGLFILPGEAGKIPLKPNPLDYPSFAFFTEVLVTPDGLGSGIVTLNLADVFTGDGNAVALDIKEASTDHRGTMSSAHWSKVEGITQTLLEQWNSAYSWGNHANAGYLTAGSVSNKLDKVTSAAQTVASSVTFAGNVSTPKLILTTQVNNTTVSALWADGNSVYYNGFGGTPKQLALFSDINSTNVAAAISTATTAQKSTMRIALLGSAVPPSPVITDVLPMFMVKNTDQYPVITGLNLTLLDPTNIFFKDSANVQSNAEVYQNINTFSIATKWKLPSSIIDGIYDMKINNGSVVQGLSTGQVQVVTNDPKVVLLSSDWKYFIYGNNIPNANFQIATDFVKLARVPSAVAFPKDDNNPLTACRLKSKNIFKGALSSSWEIILDINVASSNNGSIPSFPIIGLSETSDADFSSIDNLIMNYSLIWTDPLFIKFDPSIGSYSNGQYHQIVIKKTGNKLFFVHRDTPYGVNSVTYIKSLTIDTSKDYALTLMMPSTTSNSNHTMAYNITTRIKN
jgi:hypothetical protein